MRLILSRFPFLPLLLSLTTLALTQLNPLTLSHTHTQDFVGKVSPSSPLHLCSHHLSLPKDPQRKCPTHAHFQTPRYKHYPLLLSHHHPLETSPARPPFRSFNLRNTSFPVSPPDRTKPHCIPSPVVAHSRWDTRRLLLRHRDRKQIPDHIQSLIRPSKPPSP